MVRTKGLKLDKVDVVLKNKSPDALQKINDRVLKDITSEGK